MRSDYWSKDGITSNDWMTFETVGHKKVIPTMIKIRNHERDVWGGSAIKDIVLYSGSIGTNEPINAVQNQSNNQWVQFKTNKSVNEIQEGEYRRVNILDGQPLQTVKLVIVNNHGHKSWNRFYYFGLHGIEIE